MSDGMGSSEWQNTPAPEMPRRRHHTLITVDSHDVDDFVDQMRRIADDAEREQRISVQMLSSSGYYYLSSEQEGWLPRGKYEDALSEWSRYNRGRDIAGYAGDDDADRTG